MVAPYAAVADPVVKLVVLVCGAQMSKTEFLLNVIGWNGMDLARPAMYIGPTEKNVRSISNDRVTKMFRSTPELDALLAKGHRDKVTEKWIRGARLGFAWASSATELASHPCAVVLVDERDRMTDDVNQEGDPVVLARARTKNYRRSCALVASTPTTMHASPIWGLYEETSMAMWSWPCPECSAAVVPRLELLVFDADAPLGEIEASAVIGCPNCGAAITEDHRGALNRAGAYLYHARPGTDDPMHPEGATLERPVSAAQGFWISGLCSPWVTIGEVAREWTAAKRSADPAKIKSVTNTWGGELYRQTGDRPDWEEIEACQAGYQQGAVAYGVQVLVAGVDVQRDRLIATVRGFGHEMESWLVDKFEIFGETSFDEVWIRLGRYLSRLYGDRTITRMLVDSGYKPGAEWRVPEHIVYQFARRYPGAVFPSKGYATMARPVNLSELKREGIHLITFDGDHFKTQLYNRIRWPQSEPGSWHVYQGIDREYCRQLVSEEVITAPNGRRTWIANRRANHFFDCEVLCLVAARTLALEVLPPMPEREAQERSEREREETGRDGGSGTFQFFD